MSHSTQKVYAEGCVGQGQFLQPLILGLAPNNVLLFDDQMNFGYCCEEIRRYRIAVLDEYNFCMSFLAEMKFRNLFFKFEWLLFANWMFLIHIIWTRLNLLQFDLAGHIASAAQFYRHQYHEFSDTHFLGYIHGLFYPPLEDFLISTIRRLFFFMTDLQAFVLAYKIYLSLAFAVLFIAVFRVSSLGKTRFQKNIFVIMALLLLNMDKTNYGQILGLGFHDVLITGLSNQILAWSFFLFLFYDWVMKRSWVRLALWMALIILSHIVVTVYVGLFCLIIVIYDFKARESLKNLLTGRSPVFLAGLVAMGLTAFFWLPFLAHSREMTTSTIFANYTWEWFLLLICGALLFSEYRAITILTLAIFLFNHTLKNFGSDIKASVGELWPAFHYYRLSSAALWWLLIAYVVQNFGKRPWASYFFPVLFISIMSFHFQPFFLGASGDTLVATDLSQIEAIGEEIEKKLGVDQRVGVRELKRSVEMGLESLLYVKSEGFLSSKGLFWESNKNHSLLSSYLATLNNQPGVLDNVNYKGLSCEVINCLFEQMNQDFGISAHIFQNGPIPCSGEIFSKYKSSNIFGYQMFKTSSKSPLSVLKDVQIELIHKDEQRAPFIVFSSRVQYCQGKRQHKSIFLNSDSFKRWGGGGVDRLLTSQEVPVEMKKVGRGQYELTIHSATPLPFLIPLTYFPGAKIFNEQGQALPLIEAYPGMVAIGAGKMRLNYEQTNPMLWGFWISLFCFVIFAVVFLNQVAISQQSRDFRS